MADSSITKMAMANSLKSLMQEKNFHKISINDICVGCNMNRKSFYYHFKDKYDLLNWIFDTEFEGIKIVGAKASLSDLFYFLYNNRDFYRKAFLVEGQNSFREHLYNYLYEALSVELNKTLENDDLGKMQIQFITDGLMCALMRWITNPDCIPVDKYLEKMRFLLFHLLNVINNKSKNMSEEL